MEKKILLTIATLIVAVSLANAGCIGAIHSTIDGAFATPTPVPTTTPTPTLTPTPTVTPCPTMPDHIDIIYILPLESGRNQSTITHIINGSMSVNDGPAVGWAVVIDTSAGNEYGNVTDANGRYSVVFSGDESETYIVKLYDPLHNIIYMDQYPRLMNHTGPMSISIEIPSTNVISVSVSP
jgi:hypothetical protein